MKILLVDNDTVYLNLLAEVLTLHSYNVMKAQDGAQALELLRQEPIDLVIADVSMPGMNGMNLHRYVREDYRLKDIPFAWNSGYRELRDILQVEDSRIDFKLDKSMPIPNLLHFLNHMKPLPGNSRKDTEELEAA